MDGGVSTFYLTQGVLGATVVVLAGVIVYLQKKIDNRDSKVQQLNDLLLAQSEKNADKLFELNEKNIEVLQGNSHSNTLLAAKIEAVKDRN